MCIVYTTNFVNCIGDDESTIFNGLVDYKYQNISNKNETEIDLIKKDKSVTAHINTIKFMEDELKSVGSPLTQAKIEERILSTLPPSLRTARDS